MGSSGDARILDHVPIGSDQEDVIAALEAGLTGPPRLRRINTHMSYLFLSEDFVLKLTRAVNHPFVDMSTLAQRKAACEAEIEINKRFAPTLYDKVLPVVRTTDGTFRLAGEGTIVDYIVCMKRFPDKALFADLATSHQLTVAMIEDAVSALAAFQKTQAPQLNVSASQSYDRILAGLEQTARQAAPPVITKVLADMVFAHLKLVHTDVASLINDRREAGYIRRGHGDFHLKNICVYEGRVTPFDALAFDRKLATVDILYDVAFLFMDLRARNLDHLAALAMNRYFDLMDQDEGALLLLPFFMALRACVRMAVSIEAGLFDDTENYGRLAIRLLEPVISRLVIVGGLSGTGKSVVARAICHLLPGPCGARILSTDAERKREAGMKLADHMPQTAYDKQARSAVYTVLARRASVALEAGSSVVADGTYRDGDARTEIAKAAEIHPCLALWLQTDVERRVQRVSTRRNDASDASPNIATAQEEPQLLGQSWQRVDASGTSANTIALASLLIEKSPPRS